MRRESTQLPIRMNNLLVYSFLQFIRVGSIDLNALGRIIDKGLLFHAVSLISKTTSLPAKLSYCFSSKKYEVI